MKNVHINRIADDVVELTLIDKQETEKLFINNNQLSAIYKGELRQLANRNNIYIPVYEEGFLQGFKKTLK